MLVPLVLSLSVHEWAHAYSAFLLGDTTAARQGRLTLNPMAHIDPIGTILCPLIGIPFGWARPVPVNPVKFTRGISMRTGMMLTAAAGPLSNVVLAVTCTIVWGLAFRVIPTFALPTAGFGLLMSIAIQMNVALALFNLLPIPPLDGSRVVDGLIPYRWRPYWEQYMRYASIALLVAVVAAQYVLAAPLGYANALLGKLLNAAAGVG